MKKENRRFDRQVAHTHTQRVGLKWGRVLAGLNTAADALNKASCDGSVLSKELLDKLHEAREILVGVEQRAWGEEKMSAERLGGV